MIKKIIAMVLLAGMLCGILTGCKANLTAEDAYQVVLDDLGAAAAMMTASPHIHETTFEGKNCYNIFVTVDGMSLQYIVATNGKILHKGPGEHSH